MIDPKESAMAFENVYSATVGWTILYIFIRLTLWLKSNVSLLIFCLQDLSTDESGVLKFSIIMVLLSTFPFIFVNICFTFLCALIWGTYIFTIVGSSKQIAFSLYDVTFVSYYSF